MLSPELPPGFVYLACVAPAIAEDVRYFGGENFVGERIVGYEAPRVILTRRAAQALGRVQEELMHFGLGLKVFDGYRPQRAVDHFVRWAQDANDRRMQQALYPREAKQDLLARGYIMRRSAHSRGSTVDLTLVSLEPAAPAELDMGSPFDFFDERSDPLTADISSQQRGNRLLLRTLMLKAGFLPLDKEWWHFTLADEPFPETYFDFTVR